MYTTDRPFLSNFHYGNQRCDNNDDWEGFVSQTLEHDGKVTVAKFLAVASQKTNKYVSSRHKRLHCLPLFRKQFSWNPWGGNWDWIVTVQGAENSTLCSHNSHWFNSVPFKAKMQKFHANIATLDTPTCSTCSERIPGSFHLKPNGYLRCSSNKHAPK